ncbi:MAG: hypothetical protein A2176_00260 [Spirochaetes bacterium RBG_13_51_14]|nr:MAG: hypothetical protein A2176_00260 [Spirochaetes bacterium RBG_13_51_14]
MNAISRSIFITGIIFTVAAGAAAREGDQKLFYVINYAVSQCNAEIEVNGVPITRSEKKHSYSVNGVSDVSMWISTGKNRVTVTIRPAARQKDSGASPSIVISVSTVLQGQMSDEGKKIAELRIPEKNGDDELARIQKTTRKELEFTPQYVPPSELWGKIKQVKLDASSRKHILKLVADYHAALSRKNVDALYGFLLFASLDMARLRHQPVEEVKSKLKDNLREMLSEKGFAMAPLNIGRIILRPVADGRILWVTDPAVESPVRTRKTSDGGTISFPVYVSVIDGKWVIVR